MTHSGSKPYRIEYSAEVLGEDIPRLPKSARLLIKKAIEQRLAVDPLSYGKPLRYNLNGQRRLRVSVYRIVYVVDADRHSVLITAIKHRKDVYE